jgi:hypothetical protein
MDDLGALTAEIVDEVDRKLAADVPVDWRRLNGMMENMKTVVDVITALPENLRPRDADRFLAEADVAEAYAQVRYVLATHQWTVKEAELRRRIGQDKEEGTVEDIGQRSRWAEKVEQALSSLVAVRDKNTYATLNRLRQDQRESIPLVRKLEDAVYHLNGAIRLLGLALGELAAYAALVSAAMARPPPESGLRMVFQSVRNFFMRFVPASPAPPSEVERRHRADEAVEEIASNMAEYESKAMRVILTGDLSVLDEWPGVAERLRPLLPMMQFGLRQRAWV